MFAARFHIGFVRRSPALARPSGADPDRSAWAGRIVRAAALSGLLALGLSGTSSAQTLGTMQVAARVVPASVGWTGVAEAGAVAQSFARQGTGRALIRRTGLVQARAEIRPAGSSRVLIVTIQHPHN